jgi:deoxyribodipyrimidine photolyase-like uncharacterized protein
MIAEDPDGIYIIALLGGIPWVFSLLFFAVPILRYFWLIPKRRRRHQNNIRKRLMKVIYHNYQAPIALTHLLEAVNAQNKQEERLSQAIVQRMMQQLVSDLGGDIRLDEQGQQVYYFERLRDELDEAKKLRQARGNNRSLGQVIVEV